MIVLVTGDRNWKDYNVIYRELSKYPHGTVVFHGAARGADTLADIAAERLGFKSVPFRAEWHIYGRAAGPIRNQEMLARLLKEEEPKKVLAFHKNIAESKGTKDMVNRALKVGIDVEIIKG
jgi:argininosuccinate lyase